MAWPERFLEKVDKTAPNGCWIWMAAKNRKGYGQQKGHGFSKMTHRLSYFWEYGEFDKALLVCHKCDNPSCVNPAHLFLGTAKDNAVDRDSKGRQYDRRGEQNFSAKLTPEQVLEFRRVSKEEGIGYRRMAKRFGIPKGTMYDILSGKSWQSLEVR